MILFKRSQPRGFSLIELLLAIFILSIGVISIAALFPAGIAQQRKSVDDATGPIVANNAIAIIRAKLKPEYFGSFTNPTGEPILDPLWPTIAGDWSWRRPGFVLDPAGITLPSGCTLPPGTINIFNFNPAHSDASSEIPWNTGIFSTPAGTTPTADITITQAERYYPMAAYDDPCFATGFAGEQPPRPQYVWDCMFRRFQGRIQVAIFVYRVNEPGGETTTYTVAPNPVDSTIPPLPAGFDLADPSNAFASWNAYGVNAGDAGDDAIIPGTASGTTYSATDQFLGWQAPDQWLIDQNNNIHRVLSGRRTSNDGPVELVRPVPVMPTLPIYFLPDTNEPSTTSVVTNIWYIPPIDANGRTLTPVYATVKEL